MQELIEGIGARSDVVIEIYGDDLNTLREQADQTARILNKVTGAAAVKVEQTSGQPVLQSTWRTENFEAELRKKLPPVYPRCLVRRPWERIARPVSSMSETGLSRTYRA